MRTARAEIKSLIFRFNDDEITSLASQLAYSFILAFFPFLIFLLTLVGYSGIKSETVMVSLSSILPGSVYELVARIVGEVVSARNGNLLSISIIAALWSSSAGFGAVIRGLNKAYDEKETRGYIKVQIMNILCTIALALIIIFTFVLLVFGEVLGNFLGCCFKLSHYYLMLWDIVRYAITIISMIFVFACLYHYTPCRRLGWREVMPGALFSTAGWLLSSLAFAFYINKFSNYSRLYGSIGAVFILMTWLYISSVIILMGGELNAVLAFDREGRTKHGKVK